MTKCPFCGECYTSAGCGCGQISYPSDISNSAALIKKIIYETECPQCRTINQIDEVVEYLCCIDCGNIFKLMYLGEFGE